MSYSYSNMYDIGMEIKTYNCQATFMALPPASFNITSISLNGPDYECAVLAKGYYGAGCRWGCVPTHSLPRSSVHRAVLSAGYFDAERRRENLCNASIVRHANARRHDFLAKACPRGRRPGENDRQRSRPSHPASPVRR